MKTKDKLLLLLAFLVLQTAIGQYEKPYDSILVFQKNYKKNHFQMKPAGLKNMSITQKKPRRDTYPAGEILEDIGRVGLSLFMNAIWGEYTDTSIDDTDEVDWVLSSQIKSLTSSYNWELQVFTKGIHYKEFYASGIDIGSNSEREVWWDENTKGILLHQNDTIFRFVMLVNPDINAFIEKIAPEDFEERKVHIMSELMNTFDQGGLFLSEILTDVEHCVDVDGDEVQDGIDNCPAASNNAQADGDGDLSGDACDNLPTVAQPRPGRLRPGRRGRRVRRGRRQRRRARRNRLRAVRRVGERSSRRGGRSGLGGRGHDHAGLDAGRPGHRVEPLPGQPRRGVRPFLGLFRNRSHRRHVRRPADPRARSRLPLRGVGREHVRRVLGRSRQLGEPQNGRHLPLRSGGVSSAPARSGERL